MKSLYPPTPRLVSLLVPALLYLSLAPLPAQAAPPLSPPQQLALDTLCAGQALPRSGAGRRGVLLYREGAGVSVLQDQLPAELQPPAPDKAALVLCLEPVREIALGTCDLGLFFTGLPRIVLRMPARAVAPTRPAGTLAQPAFEGAAPPTCQAAGEGPLDSSMQALRGQPPGAAAIRAWLEAQAISQADADGDGLSGLQEFLAGSDPADGASPGAAVRVHANGGPELTLFEGSPLSLDLSVHSGPWRGEPATYTLWADTPQGRFDYHHPGGFVPAGQGGPARLRAPVVDLAHYPLFTLPRAPAGEYTVHVELEDAGGHFAPARTAVHVLPDPCRAPRGLPFTETGAWSADCPARHSPDSADLARYYPFRLSSQGSVHITLESADQPGDLRLLAGAGRDGPLLATAERGQAGAILQTELDAGHYTIEAAAAGTGPERGGHFTLSASADDRPWRFTAAGRSAGFDYRHGYARIQGGILRDRQRFAAGVAAGDYDQDGWIDLYVTRGSAGPNLLFRNRGDGRFDEVGAAAGVDLRDMEGGGPVFADFSGDGWPDLFVPGINTSTLPVLLRNRQDGSFEDVTAQAGIGRIVNAMGASLGDYDRDGDLDLYTTHWTANLQGGKYLWRNEGGGRFTDASQAAGIPDGLMNDYSATFADINNDGWPDLLVAADFGTSQVFVNERDGGFRLSTGAAISDENGMGSAVGDYDNDGDLDWFVSSIHDPNGPPHEASGLNWRDSGNRFYANRGDGSFEDLTDATGTRFGYWGWGSCFADFNNDGLLDLFHVNGFGGSPPLTAPFENDPARLFINRGDGGFDERAAELGVADTGQGRGIVCFDYDRDGDVDIFVANNEQPPALYRNDGGNDRNFLHLRLAGDAQAVGARIYLTAAGRTQMRELHAGSNYMSQNPLEAYFGLDRTETVEEIRVVWPSGQEKTLTNVAANQYLIVTP